MTPRFDEKRDEYERNRKFFDLLSQNGFVDIRLGQIVISEKGERQKGVDTLIAIDMLSKAYMDHYDVAILLSGDRDLVSLVKAVKDMSGKRVFGVFFEGHCADELRRAFDKRLEIADENLSKIVPE